MTDNQDPNFHKRLLCALVITLAFMLYIFGTLWLCVYLSWWFATIYALPVLFAKIYTHIKQMEMQDELFKKLHNDK